MARISKTQRLKEYRGLIKFAREHSALMEVALDGKVVPFGRLADVLQAYVDAAARTETALQAYRSAVKQEATLLAKARPRALGIATMARQWLGKAAPQLEVYGVKPVKHTKKSLAVLAAQVEKMRSTRKARGTMGKRQRQRLKREGRL